MDIPAATNSGARRAARLRARGAALPPRRRRDQGLDRGEGGRARHRRPRQGPALRADAAAQARRLGARSSRTRRQDPAAGRHRQPPHVDARRLRRRHLQQATRDQRGLATTAGASQRAQGETTRLLRLAEVRRQ
ncbi:hypothetical protein O3G_MSEX001054 [Manduca sexta]|nr:hypothetical protein O3G_MSEX001054 [Manduca sexta]